MTDCACFVGLTRHIRTAGNPAVQTFNMLSTLAGNKPFCMLQQQLPLHPCLCYPAAATAAAWRCTCALYYS
jgi:hypothetical protein